MAVWVRALGGHLDDEALAVVRKKLASPIEEPSAGRALLEALPADERERLADGLGFDVLATSVLEDPPAVYLRGAFHWVDLSPALTRRLVCEVASWERVPGTDDSPSLAPAAEEAVAASLARGASAAEAVREALADARPVGRRILERAVAQRTPA